MSDQLVQPLFGHSAVALLVNVNSVSRAGRLSINQHAKFHGRSWRWRAHDKMKIAGMKAVGDAPIGLVQDDSFDASDSITICAFTTDETEAPLFRLPVEANERNGLRATCRLMVDKITTVPKTKVGARVGRLDDEDILRLNQAVLVFLGLAVSPRIRPENSLARTA